MGSGKINVSDHDTIKPAPHGGMHMQKLDQIPAEKISNRERESLLLLIEEEKLARDVYLSFQEKYSLPAFKNIHRSEQQHMNEVKYLLERYMIDDPTEGKANGEFVNSEFRELYKNLTAKGNENLAEALKAGAYIEEVDIRDLKNELDKHVDNADIEYVFNNLIMGSENHLRAFTRILKMQGVEYKPVILEDQYYKSIINNQNNHQ